MFIVGKCKLKNIVSFPPEIGKWLILHKIPLLSYDEDGNFIFANTKALKEEIKILPKELKGGVK